MAVSVISFTQITTGAFVITDSNYLNYLKIAGTSAL